MKFCHVQSNLSQKYDYLLHSDGIWRQNHMIPRLLQLPDDESLFLFGPRGVGKTTLLKHLPWFSNALYINLLKPSEEQRFARSPDELIAIVRQWQINISAY